MRGFIPPKTDEEQLLVKRVRELAEISLKKRINRSTLFLSDRQQQLALSVLSGYEGAYKLYGGYDNAERKIIFFGEGIEEKLIEQIICVNVKPAFSKVNDTTLTHRDFLGAFLSLGLKREALGDIVPVNNGCAVFATKSAAELLVNELTGVGRLDACAEEKSFSQLSVLITQPKLLTATLSSLRLDSIISAMLKVSRSSAQQIISSKYVTVNHIEVTSLHYEIQENDVFTVKGYGKYKLSEIGGKSKKDRIFINYQIY